MRNIIAEPPVRETVNEWNKRWKVKQTQTSKLTHACIILYTVQ